MRDFYLSHVITIIGLTLAWLWGGVEGFFIAALLMVLEVSFSFENAIVNTAILKKMDAKWRGRFLTWGMVVAVLGMRLLFPVLLVAFATDLGIVEVARLALQKPEEYSQHIIAANLQISAFGGMFLLMVFLHFIFDDGKEIHWLGMVEKKLAAAGKMESVEVVISLIILLALQQILPPEAGYSAIIFGLVGVLLYVIINSTMLIFMGEKGNIVAKNFASSGLIGFLYLEILDMSFSLDGVIGAFAISKDVVIILIGLAIGAMFVRSLTVHLVRKNTLENYIFLVHGAHYGIGILAIIMLASTIIHIPEPVTGLTGVVFIGISMWSSICHNKHNGQK